MNDWVFHLFACSATDKADWVMLGSVPTPSANLVFAPTSPPFTHLILPFQRVSVNSSTKGSQSIVGGQNQHVDMS
jgi:hypothetical protein